MFKGFAHLHTIVELSRLPKSLHRTQFLYVFVQFPCVLPVGFPDEFNDGRVTVAELKKLFIEVFWWYV